MKKRLSFILIFFLVFNFVLPMNLLVYAQEASQSAVTVTPEVSPTVSVSPMATEAPIATEAPTASPTISTPSAIPTFLETTPTDVPLEAVPTMIEQIPTGVEPTPTEVAPTPTVFIPTPTPTLTLENPVSNPSASVKQPVKIKLLSGSILRGGESLTLELLNTENNPISSKLVRGETEIATTINFRQILGTKILVVQPPANFEPGSYRLIIIDSLGNSEIIDFSWGVLAINTNKSIYLPNEIANLSMAVLDEQGKMVCDAKLKLRITNYELGIEDELSTENGKIIVNPECQTHEYTEKPDYEASYQVGEAGTYRMTLTAETKNGTYSIEDLFEVRDTVIFTVERLTATRIFPLNSYPVNLKITANEDFSGEVVEFVPKSFEISASGSGEILTYDRIEEAKVLEKKTIVGGLPADLGFPFSGSYPISLGFGEIPSDENLQQEYEKLGAIGHDGVDFSLPEGTSVLAVDDGEIVQSGEGDYGTTITIKHNWGWSIYGHLKEISVSESQKIKKGEQIGLSGDTGFSTGPHLHFSLKPNEFDIGNGFLGKIDPAPYLGVDKNISQLKNIIWKVNLKKGESLMLGYNYKSPEQSPAFYLLGPLEFLKGQEVVFQEARQWQIAVDAVVKWLTHRSTETVDSVPVVTSNANMSETAQESTAETTSLASFGTTTGYYLMKPGAAAGTGLTPGTSPQGFGWWTTNPFLGSSASANWTFNASTTDNKSAAVCRLRVIAYINTSRSTTGATQLFDTGDLTTDLCIKGTSTPADTYNPGAINLTTVSPSGTAKYILFEYWINVSTGATGGSIYLSIDGASGTGVTPEATNTFVAGANITGTIYSDEGSTAISTQPAMKVYKDGTICTSCTGSAAATGVYTLAVETPSSGNTITSYIDGDATYKGSLITTYNPANTAAGGKNMTAQNIYKDRVIVRGTAAANVANTDLADWDNDNDTDTLFYSNTGSYTCRSASYTGLCVDTGKELHSWTGTTFVPGGNVTADNLHLAGTYTGASEILTLSGSGTGICTTAPGTIRPFCIDGGSYGYNTNTTKFTGSSDSNIEGTTYYDLTFAAASGTPVYTLLGTTTAARDLTITAGNLSPGSNILNVARNWTNSGSFAKGTSSVVWNGNGGTTQIIAGSTEFYDLTAQASTARIITFTYDTTQTITHALNFSGSTGEVITLQSSSSPSKWNINTTGIASPTLTYLSVTDSNSTVCLQPTNSSGSSDTNWDFVGTGCAATGPTLDQLTRHGGWFNSSGARQPFTF